MSNIFPIDFEEKFTMAQDDYILFSDSEDGNKIKKAQYKNLKGEQGDPGTPGTPGKDGKDGTDGTAATITVGSTTTGTPGSSASVTNSGTSSAAILDFTIPQGAKGEPGKDGQDGADGNDGEAATITIGTTTTLSPGSSATVTNVGTSSAAILDFGIPQGTPGTGSGDVVGPASSTDGHIAVFDGATGKIIKDGGEIPTGDVGISSDTGNLLTAGVNLWLGTESDFSSISTPDTNTLYIQYKSDGGGGWQPGVNTIAYYPLNTDLNDVSGNNRNLTQKSGTTIITTLNGVECAYVNHSSVLYTDNSTILSYTGRTVNMRIYIANDSQTWWGGIGRGGNSYGDYNTSGIGFVYNGGLTVSDYVSNFSVNGISKNTWYNIVLAQSGTELKIYVNGSLVNTETVDITGEGAEAKCIALGCNSSYPFDGNSSQAYYSEVIFESKQRTAQEVLDYYNATKSTYGIS